MSETSRAESSCRPGKLRAVVDLIEQAGRWPSALFVGYILSAVALALATMSGSLPLFFTVFLINYLCDWALRVRGDYVNRKMQRFGFGERIRDLNRILLFMALALITSSPAMMPLALLLGALFGLNSLHEPLVSFRMRRRNLPVAVLNISLGKTSIPDSPRGGTWQRYGLNRIPGPELLLVGAGAAVIAGADSRWLLLGAIAPLASLLAVLHAALHALRNATLPQAEDLIERINERLDEYRPEVVLYFTFASNGQDFMYQVNMWVDALENIDRRAVIILRETGALAQLDQTRLPVVCVRKADHLAMLNLPAVRVVLYPGNAGKNVHMLQKAEARHVFIGHGDSDKLASSNRVSRVFDEIWVAGKAGRDRYQRVRHAIDDSTIVEVGRPQLSAVRAAGPKHADGVLTVLYGPTWEGWTDEACHTSLIPMGEKIISELLQIDRVRVIYKPHPLTGRRSDAAARADQRVQQLLRADNERRMSARDNKRAAVVEERLGELERLIADRSGSLGEGDRLQRTRDARWGQGEVRAELERLTRQWNELFWGEEYQGGQHLVVRGRQPSLYDCFNQSDLLISDMSSVISDFVASCKPYVVTNAADTDPDAYRLQNPTAGAAYLLGSDCSELSHILELVRRSDGDPLAGRRLELREYLLGPHEPTSMMLFNAAVENLYQKGERTFPLGSTAVPVPTAPVYTDIIPRQSVGERLIQKAPEMT
ncbi:hypothetical protein PJ985_03825 [Streptomyces sp. ACA25]|uniref:hypothetical protein n=1 Tax=Streptomyces sp. ACA25 TaxID=3022596 RepID=UPI002306EF96|nr:hypothetical protein [Streptomyces sp. ACA25]MDB1086695.1 hypothetical protein [Streptomyces sp. ACA25]